MAEGSASIADATQVARSGAVILLVDDDNAVREVTASILEEIGYVVVKVGSGGAALDVLDQHTKIDLVLLDFAMPGMSGVELARRIQEKFPSVPILFVTGHADKTALEGVGDERIIKKPFVDDELTTKVHTALIKRAPRSSEKVVVLLRH